MARVTHVAQTPCVWKDGTVATNGDETIINFTAATPADDEATLLTGNEIILVHNTSTDTQYTFTITTTPDDLGRTATIGPIQVEFGEHHWFQADSLEGFRQSDGKLYFEASNAAIKFAVLRPRHV